jgi:23S rRNA pseudouridine955/2504/2580 synthase/23S rRNA pseudouridine1911/1915/1917 synthase
MKFSSWIIFENDDFIVLHKPSGLLSIPDRKGVDISLKKILQEHYGEIFTVHRLDKETSGLIVFAKNENTHQHLSRQFEERQTKKLYLGLVIGSVPEASGTINAPISENPSKKGIMSVHRNGKEAITDFELLTNFGSYSWMQFRIYTGRTHQIRVHMKHYGHPIVCDPVYGDGKPLLLSSIKKRFKLSKKEEEEKPMLDRLALHAWQLQFEGPDGSSHSFEAPIPKDLRAILQQLSNSKKIKPRP